MSTMDTLFQGQGTATDPVCEMDVDMANPPGGTHEHEGTTYYFCAPGCREAFAGDPATFLADSDHEGHESHEGHDHPH